MGLTEGQSAVVTSAKGSECDLCRKKLEAGMAFHRITLGMTDVPLIQGETHCYVESTTDMDVCTACEPKASALFDRLLAELWRERSEDPPTARFEAAERKGSAE